jgi:hypothetical protein
MHADVFHKKKKLGGVKYKKNESRPLAMSGRETEEKCDYGEMYGYLVRLPAIPSQS